MGFSYTKVTTDWGLAVLVCPNDERSLQDDRDAVIDEAGVAVDMLDFMQVIC